MLLLFYKIVMAAYEMTHDIASSGYDIMNIGRHYDLVRFACYFQLG